ncbi:Cof-type HAD-IIB family hydrolase [Oceanobacillus rekensis]|uniref:Cof-type HAD-IIB family hydrolase n=1 Tax=Oceanobacillus rekensis TaxID=937927 RepID=UPI000B448EB2|nr:Cof-type HAD-IIB family hydrolase [Oceanobacillus rekensis]
MKLIAIDLDGTLLSEDGSISNENRDAILKVQGRGDIIVISSGRSLHDTKQILQDAMLDCPIITGNGAVAFDSDKILQNLYLEPEVIGELMDILDGDKLYYELYTNKGVYVEEGGRELLNKEIKRLHGLDADLEVEAANRIVEIQYEQNGLTFVPNYRSIDYKPLEVYKIFILSFDKEKLLKLRGNLQERKDISITTSGQQKLEIGNRESSKGNALQFIANHFGVPIENTVAIGDNLNDLSMFNVAGISIAMGNAEEVVKEQATFITTNCSEGGVAYGLRQYIS